VFGVFVCCFRDRDVACCSLDGFTHGDKSQLGHSVTASSVSETSPSDTVTACDPFPRGRDLATFDSGIPTSMAPGDMDVLDAVLEKHRRSTPMQAAAEEEFDDDYCVISETGPERVTETDVAWLLTHDDDSLFSTSMKARNDKTDLTHVMSDKIQRAYDVDPRAADQASKCKTLEDQELRIDENVTIPLHRQEVVLGVTGGDSCLSSSELQCIDVDSVFCHPDVIKPFFEHSQCECSPLSSAAPSSALRRPTSLGPGQLLEPPEGRTTLPIPFAADFLRPSSLSAHVAVDDRLSSQAVVNDDDDDIVVIPEEVQRLPDGTVFRRRVVNTRLRTVVTRRVRTVGSDGHPIEYTLTEEFSPDEQSSSPLPARKLRVIDRASVDLGRLELQQTGTTVDNSEFSFLIPERHRRMVRSAAGDLSTERVPVRPIPTTLPSSSDATYLPPPPPVIVAGIYTDTDRPGEPTIDVDELACTKEMLPDGRVVERRTVRTRQRRTIVKRIVLRSSHLSPTPRLPSTRDDCRRDDQYETKEVSSTTR